MSTIIKNNQILIEFNTFHSIAAKFPRKGLNFLSENFHKVLFSLTKRPHKAAF